MGEVVHVIRDDGSTDESLDPRLAEPQSSRRFSLIARGETSQFGVNTARKGIMSGLRSEDIPLA